MKNQQLRRTCVRVLLNHLTRGEEGRPVALGCKLVRSQMTVDDVATIWARLGDELRQHATPNAVVATGEWGPLREFLVEYRAVMRERLRPERRRPCIVRAERRPTV